MRKNIEITDEQYKKLLNKFYSYFDTGYAFEEFLKIYLEKIGLDEVSVTQRSRDGGIDLKAVRNGVGGFSKADEVEYYIQAKRFLPTSSISVTKIRELKGTIPFGHKGIFITTARFSADAQRESINDPSKPVILIDGRTLVDSCIEHELGFVFIPVFSKTAMDKLYERSNDINSNVTSNDFESAEITVEKMITNNDIRARILRIPKVIIEKIPAIDSSYSVTFNNEYTKELSIDKTRTFFCRITDIFKKYKLIDEDGAFISKKSTWYWNNGKIDIIISRED